ncbi:MAG: RsmB/NOP family class I SAM-dependent RNA methyltransferase, partial [Proteobacteria bacterium]|nr:RsmB/NOP family class I SAM-dependent RNA methyltransferase [Pseudomonadota bacterium]MBU1594876.1 RsmB/NOP family class I SAM-dependent RNA methyltransferase [Pseudomonadota bacterium]
LPGLAGVLRVGGAGGGAAAGQGQGFFLARFVRQDGAAKGAFDAGQGGADIAGRTLLARDIASAGPLTAGNLPPGEVRDFGGKVYFLHQEALGLLGRSPGLRWQGLPLGTMSGGRFRPDPRARVLLPRPEELPASQRLDVDEPRPILDLLAGRSLELPGEGGLAGLYFRGLPLGLVTRKGRRLVWSNR